MQRTYHLRKGQRYFYPWAVLTAFGFTLVVCWSAMAADTSEYKPPGDFYTMQAHFTWCGEAKTPAARVRRYEKFWELQAPEESDGYDDMPHVRTVRQCAYKLAQLYAELRRTKECLKMLKWLEKEDDTLKVDKG